MKKLLVAALLLLTSSVGFSQTCPTPTSSGVYVTLDTNYQLGTVAAGFTNVGMCFYNNTTTDITAFQYRVYYDNNAFSGVDTVTSLNTSFSQYLNYVDNPSGGYVTITLTYTGSLATFEIPNGPIINLKLNHVSGFASLTSVANMSFGTVVTFPALSTKQDGTDNTLTLQNFGGVMLPQTFSFTGTFTNVTGTGAKNLTVGLEKKLRPSGSWTSVTSTSTNNSGIFAFNDIAVDTTGYDVRIKIVGDTMSVGNVISTADAQKVNDYVLGTQTPTGFDYYAADVNGDNNITISDAYGVFGRISGRFSVWPNSVKDVKFFTSTEYTTINGSSTNYLSSIPGTTNFTFNIIAGAPSPTFYVLVPGDANGTGYHMARVTPIEVLINPQPGVESQIYNVIDNRVEYDFPTTSIEVNVPRLSVQEGNLVNIPEPSNVTFYSVIPFESLSPGDIIYGNAAQTIPPDTETNIIFRIVFHSDEAETKRGVNIDDFVISGTLSSENFELNNVFVYPNPSKGIFNISLGNLQPTEIEVYDLMGKKVYAKKEITISNFETKIDLSNVTQGIYFVKIKDNNQSTVKRIIKE